MTEAPPQEGPPRRSLLDLDLPALEALVADELGEPPYRARQIFHAVYQEGLRDYESMTALPRPLRQRLAGRLKLELPSVHQVRSSADGSRKYVLELADGKRIESVYLVDDGRLTFCLSSQVGCAFGCDFCLTAGMGLVRQMSPGEILGQVLRLADEGDHGRLGYNLVFMGMGEPLHNFDALATALQVLLSPRGLNLSYRRVTVSTVGDVKGIRRLASLERRPRLAVSLNAAEDSLRSRMMPVNRANPLAKLLGALEEYPLRRGERITFEYVLLAGVNDSPEQADALARWVRRVPSKVNLIPFNEAKGLPYVEPEAPRVDAFRERLLERDVAATVRWSRGRDIQAACGQLAVTEVA
jgi:23S rRNA (adenine2503-C2)-methyltransferase